MSQLWKKSNRRKTRTPARRPKLLRPNLAVIPLDDRILPSTFTATNSTPILIPGNQNETPGSGPASPDPSTITVSGLTGVVSHLTVTLNGLSHESGSDVQVVLLAPNGTNIYLLANNGGVNDPVSASPVFDSSATTTISSATPIGNGPYAPMNDGSRVPANFPPSAPAAVTTMGIGGFYGINPNGTWSLYVDDVSAFDVGQMTGGWTLSFNYQPNSAPVANNDTYTVNENSTLTVSTAATGILGNDTDADSNPLTPHIVTSPTNGTVTLNPDGTFTYVPNLYFSGTDTFTYKDDDGIVYGNTATVTINVAHVATPPQALADSYTLQNGGAQYVGPGFGVLANDIEPDGATPNYSYYSENFSEVPLQPFPANIQLSAPGVPAANNTGTDWSPSLPAGWTVDNSPTSNTANQTPPNPTLPPTTATPMPNPPPTGQTYDGSAAFYGWRVMNIDSWIAQQGDQDRSLFLNERNFPGFNQPTGNYANTGSHTPVLVADGDAYDDYISLGTNHMNTYAYLPPVALNGALGNTLKLSFDQSFRPEDPSDGAQDATVDVSFNGGATWTNLLTQNNVNPNNPSGPLLAAGDTSRTNQHVSLSVNNPVGATVEFRFGYLDASNEWWWAIDNINVTATRTNAATLTAAVASQPTHGTLNFNADGSFTYTANPTGYTGADSFTYTTTFGTSTTAPQTVSIQVKANATAPVANNDAYTTTQDHAVTVTAPFGLLVNDTDPDTSGFVGLTTSEVTPPTHGMLTFNIDGSFTYTPTAGFYGADSFTYKDSDGVNTSNTATATITVKPLSPVLGNDTYRVGENSVLTTITSDGVLANDYDPGMLPMTASLATMPTHGTLNFSPDGTFIYTPTPGYFGPDSFTYNVTDGTYSSVTPGVVSITVVSLPPVPTNDTYSVNENKTLTVTAATGVLANDHDPNNQTLTAILVGTGPAHGAVTLNSDGSFTYVPNANYNGPDSFTYQAFDAAYIIGTVATVNITVTHVATVAANPDAYATPAGTALTTTATNGLLANDVNDGTGTSLLTENLTELPLQPFPVGTHAGGQYQGPTGGVTNNPNGDWTDALPTGWSLNNSPVGLSPTPQPDPTVPAAEIYYGWHVFDIDSWIHEQGNQSRNTFLNEANYGGYSQAPSLTGLVGSHTPVFVADGDGYFDYSHTTPGGVINSYLYTPSISLTGINKNSLTLDFDSSYRPESGGQNGTVDVSYDGGTTWTNLLNYNNFNTDSINPNVGNLANANNHVTLAAENPTGATTAMFRFGYLDAGNEWYWAIDHINVTGQTPPPPTTTLTAAVAAQPHHGTVSINPDGTFTYTPNAGYTGLDSFTYTASNGTTVSAPATATVLVGNSSVGVEVNDGSAQRSEVRSITVAFNGTASISSLNNPATAFQLTQVAGGASVALTAKVINADGLTDVVLTFSGAATDPVSAMNGGAPSLADGLYSLTIPSAKVDVNGVALDGNNDGTPGGDYVSPADTLGGGPGQLGLFRLFGDATGNGVVDALDLGQFRTAYNTNTSNALYLAYLDADNSGSIDAQDLGQFRTRYNTKVFS